MTKRNKGIPSFRDPLAMQPQGRDTWDDDIDMHTFPITRQFTDEKKI